MVATDINPQMQAIGSNPGILVRAPDYIGDKATLAYSSNYLDGKAVKGEYSGQVLMETTWFKNGVLNNIVLPTLLIEASTPASQNLIDNLIITVYKRTITGTQLETKELTVPYQTGISDGVGQMPVSMWVNRQATEFPWFDIRYEYKFVVSVGKLTSGQYLYLEGMYLQFVPNTSVMLFQQEAYGSNSVQAVPIIEGFSFTATMDGSGNFAYQFPSDYFDGAGSTTGGQRSLMNSIDAVILGFDYGTTADTSSVLTAGYDIDEGGGLTVKVTVTGLTAGATYAFQCIVIGYITPKAM